MVGLQALLMVFYLKAIDRVLKRQNKGIKQILRNKNRIDNIHEILIGALSEHAALQRLYGALIIRLATHIKLPNTKAISSEIGDYDFFLEKSLHEVNLFSTEKTRNQSAIRALSEEYGDIASLELMEKSLMHSKSKKDLKTGIKQLKKRLARLITPSSSHNKAN